MTRTTAVDQYETRLNNKTECRIFPYKRVSFEKYSYMYLDSIKNVAEYFFMKCVKGRTLSEVIRKKHNFGSLGKLCAM